MGGTSTAGVAYFRPYLTPTGDERWREAEYVVNPSSGSFDGVVVHQSIRSLAHAFELDCPRTRTLLVVKEPPELTDAPSCIYRPICVCY